jgi:hypothetical protein
MMFGSGADIKRHALHAACMHLRDRKPWDDKIGVVEAHIHHAEAIAN